MDELFQIHPLPWTGSDMWEGYEGDVGVFDANGEPVIFTGNMEGCSWEDIKLADLVATAPDLLALAELVAESVSEDGEYNVRTAEHTLAELRQMARAAIRKVHALGPES